MNAFASHLTIADTILRNRLHFFDQLRGSTDLALKIRAMLLSCLLFLGLYGAVMGASHSLPQALSSAVKLPVLFLVTLLICAPSLHFFNILFGSKQTIGQTLALILTAMTTTSVILVSFAPVTFFFLLTSSDYGFFKLLNVALFGIAGSMGLIFLRHGLAIIGESDNIQGVRERRAIFTLWIILYAFVGTQMAWTLSPFMGNPDNPFILLQQLGGNFYSDVVTTLMALVGR